MKFLGRAKKFLYHHHPVSFTFVYFSWRGLDVFYVFCLLILAYGMMVDSNKRHLSHCRSGETLSFTLLSNTYSVWEAETMSFNTMLFSVYSIFWHVGKDKLPFWIPYVIRLCQQVIAATLLRARQLEESTKGKHESTLLKAWEPFSMGFKLL